MSLVELDAAGGYSPILKTPRYSPNPNRTLSPWRSSQTDSYVQRQYAVIGIDFGTTYSGVSWTWSGNLSFTDQIHSWRGAGRDRDSDKVPSKVIYDQFGHIKGWGFDPAFDGQYVVQWFKLLLSDEACELDRRTGEPQEPKVRDAQRALKALSKQPVEVVADYLRLLWQHTIQQMELKLTKIALDNMDIRVVLTIPANWDPSAQKRTKDAADKAGITARRGNSTPVLRLVTEPEAAALAAWKDAGLRLRPDILIGDSFTVCDAGGGTVDLISYRVESLSPLRLAMCVEPTGGFCGAVYLDQAFEAHIRVRVGTNDYDRLPAQNKVKALDKEWEYGVKRAYDGNAYQTYEFTINGWKPPRIGFRLQRPNPAIILEPGHVNSIFNPICNKVVDLVRTQVLEMQSKHIHAKAILLVGGFGDNSYLLQRLQEAWPAIPIQRPQNAWTAISRGAVAKGLSNTIDDEVVTNTISRYSYGVAYAARFDPRLHLEEDRYFCPYMSVDKAKNQIQWYLRKGQEVKKENSVTHEFIRMLRTRWDMSNIQVNILYCDAKDPPTRKTTNVKPICNITTDFIPEMFLDLETRQNTTGVTYRVLPYSLLMNVTAEDAEWIVSANNQRRGSGLTTINYDS